MAQAKAADRAGGIYASEVVRQSSAGGHGHAWMQRAHRREVWQNVEEDFVINGG